MRTAVLALQAILILVAACAPGTAVTIHVPDGEPTIACGVDAAAAGDTVLVACGTYYEYDIEMKDLDCIRGRQLAGLIEAQVVFCGTYTPDGDGFRLDARFIDSSGEEFPVAPITVPENGQREAAEHVYQSLQVQSDQARYTRFCGEYAASQQWSEAESMCTARLTFFGSSCMEA